MRTKLKIGYALGGGGARGVAHIGVLRILESEGIKPDYLTGSSFGAAVASAYALGMSAEEIKEEILSKRKRDILKMIDFSRPHTSLLKGSRIVKYLEEIFEDKTFADTKIPLTIVTTDLETGEEVLINEGRIVDAIQASIAVPGIFPPVKYQDKLLIDGGVANPTPVDVAMKMGADKVIGVDLVLVKKVNFRNPGMIKTMKQAYEIIRSQAVSYKMKEAKDYAILVRPEFDGVIDSFKFHDLLKFLHAGEKATKELLPEIKKHLRME